MFLIGSLLFWIFFGWLADYSFPFGQAIDICVACFRGTLASKVNSLQQKFQSIDIVSQPDNQQQVKKLTNLESQAWLYKGVLERLGEFPSTNHERIARTLEALESKRNQILRELVPIRPQKYKFFADVQKSARIFVARFSLDGQAAEDYEQLDRLVTNLVLFAKSRQPSQIILSEVIERIDILIARNNNQISPYRLRLAYKVEDLIKVLSAKLVLGVGSPRTDSTYQAHINELRSRINLLSQQFNNLLRSRQENSNKLNRSVQKISNLNRNISDLERDIQTAQELDQRRQTQINNLRNQLSQKELELQQQRIELNNLRTQRSQINRSQPSRPTYKPPQPSVKPIVTKRRVSVEEYQKIFNKNDYVYVKAHYRNGSYIKEHYRRKPSKLRRKSI